MAITLQSLVTYARLSPYLFLSLFGILSFSLGFFLPFYLNFNHTSTIIISDTTSKSSLAQETDIMDSYYLRTEMLENQHTEISQKLLELSSLVSQTSGDNAIIFPTELQRCTRNPFIAFITPEEFQQYEIWALRQRLLTPYLIRELDKNKTREDNWNRLIPIIPHACDGRLVRVGAAGDGGKIICGLEQMDDTNCIIFSLGSNNDWSFEVDLLSRKKGCKTITFDCTGNFTVPKDIQDRAIFSPICLGTKDYETDDKKQFRTLSTLMKTYNITQIHFLKMDIENSEWAYFKDLFNNTKPTDSDHLPDQIVVEVHWMERKWRGVSVPDVRWLADLVDGWYDLGYRIIEREMNPVNADCYEITLVRFRC